MVIEDRMYLLIRVLQVTTDLLIQHRLHKIAGRCPHLARKTRNHTSKPAADTVKANNFHTVCHKKNLIVVLLLSQRAFNVCFLEQKATLTHLCVYA